MTETEILIIINIIYILERILGYDKQFGYFHNVALYHPRLPEVLNDLYIKSQQIWNDKSTTFVHQRDVKVTTLSFFNNNQT
eukprot:UN10175